ncbi:MAG TPA: nucleotide exchange factor GrpE, partial [Candidatus Polarisedimenticolaceae bacterium]|nr:nucleotide exchange factor GrpE [Candidatus Polarisedimenticolaceae bacterium]
EVVGVDEDGIPVETEDPDDVEVVFEDVPAAPAARRSVPPPEDPALKERFVRLQADFENYKKRIDRERSDYFRHATSGLVGRLLPVLDNFERAIAAARGRADTFSEGVVLIQRQLLEELSREGLHPMDPVGSPFDPEMHEAVATDPTSDAPAHTVTAVLQRGWFFHDRVLRAALVRVSVDGGGIPPAEAAGEES